MVHAEFLLLVYDSEPQIFQFYFFSEKLVRSDYEVERTVFETLQGIFFLLARCESREHPDTYGVIPKSRNCSSVVLACEKGGGGNHHDLFSVKACFKSGTQGHLGLSEPDVSADKPVHGLFGFHVGHYVLYRRRLIRGLAPGELHLEFIEHLISRGESKAFSDFSLCAQFHKLGCDFLHCPFNLADGFFPVRASQFFNPGFPSVPHVFLNQSGFLHRDEYLVPALILALEKIALAALKRKPL